MVTANDRSHESIINDTLARLFREECGLSAVAETLRPGVRPDIIVRSDQAVVVVETELEPAPTVEADALSRLGMEIDGRRVENVFAFRPATGKPNNIALPRGSPSPTNYGRGVSGNGGWGWSEGSRSP